MSLDDYLNEKQVVLLEGHSQNWEAQQKTLRRFAMQSSVQTILEIGFNGGHSAEVFLKSNPGCRVVSFDLGEHAYVHVGKEYIDTAFPERHTLILGNSVWTLSSYPQTTFDIIFIDGGHDVFVAVSDLIHCKRFAHESTLVFMDDVVERPDWTKHWNVGPTTAWKEAVRNGVVRQWGHADYAEGRGMSWGVYLRR